MWAGVRKSSSLNRLPKNQIHCIDLRYNDVDMLTKQLQEHISVYGAWDFVVHNAGLTKAVHPADFFEVNAENTRRLRERETEDDDGPERMRPNVREGNAAQGQGALHRIPSPVPATPIQRAGRTPYCRSTFAPLSDGAPEASTNCVANP